MKAQINPFADPGAASKRATAKRLFWMTVVTLVVIAGGVFGWMAYQQEVQRLDRLRAELDQARALATRTQAEVAELNNKLVSSESQVAELRHNLVSSQSQVVDLQGNLASTHAKVADLEKEKETVTQTHKGLEEEMRAKLESKDVTISQLQGKLTVNILDRILFDSGEAVLKSAGEAVLQKIAGILAQHPTLKIHVIGHTDNVPIRAGARSRFTSNWQLSTARALAAVRFLTETAGVDPRRTGAVGYGEFRPIADNSTPEGRSKNRRIAISILADELAGADTVPTATTNSPVLAAPVKPEPAEPAAEEH